MIQKDKAIMRCNGRFYWAIATIGFVAASTTAFGALTQAEVDRIVDNEILMCEHEEDAAAIEKSLKERGATGEMLAHGYYFVMEKTKNAEKGSLDSEKFHSAAFGFANVASGTMLICLMRLRPLLTSWTSRMRFWPITDESLARGPFCGGAWTKQA